MESNCKNNLVELTGHHTCSLENDDNYVVKNAPFKSMFRKNSPRNPFLGSRYYFWDYNLPMAHRWGEFHYNNQYRILEFELNIDEGGFLDLVGDRKHLEFLVKIRQKLVEDGLVTSEYSLGDLIEFLKSYDIDYPGFFPIKVVRAVDLDVKSNSVMIKFVDRTKHHTNIDPCLIICFYTKEGLNLTTRKIIFNTKNNVQSR